MQKRPQNQDLSRQANTGLPSSVADLHAPIRRRLMDRGMTGIDLEDMCGEALIRLIGAIHRNTEEGGAPIENPMSYALTVADTVFDDHLRRTHPNWHRLKRRILYLLDGKEPRNPFARWRIRLDWLAGFARWHGTPFRPTPRYRQLVGAGRQCPAIQSALSNRPADQVPLPELMAIVFRLAETPLDLNELTTLLANLQQIEEPTQLSLEDLTGDPAGADMLSTTANAIAEQVIAGVAGARLRTQLWQALCAVPLRQRHALLLTMERDELLLLGPLSQLADLLEFSLPELTSLWPQLPLSDQTLAGRMDLTAKQVANLRKCARERIQRKLEKLE